MDLLLAIIISILMLIIGMAATFLIEKWVNRNPKYNDGDVVIDKDGGEFNIFCSFAQDPKTSLRDGQILKMKVIDISQEKQSP